MKFVVFYRENNNFDDILNDKTVSKFRKIKMIFNETLILSFEETKEAKNALTYISLKYGDDMKSFDSLSKDLSPVMYKDYYPTRKPKSA